MSILTINLSNCYGIGALQHDFDFAPGGGQSQKSKAYAIYAPNGLMKSSFAKVFDNLAAGESPREERFNRQSSCEVEVDGRNIEPDSIYVLNSTVKIDRESPAITNILVNPEHKARYDEILVDLDKLKIKVLSSLQKKSKVKKSDVESALLKDWNASKFADCIRRIKNSPVTDDFSSFVYATIFDSKALDILQSPDFLSNAEQFNQRYKELFDKVGTIYQKGVFNPTKADASFSTLDKQGFFAGGHRVHFSGDTASVDKAELDAKLEQIHAEIDGDLALKQIRNKLSKNAQTQALTDLLEGFSATQTELFLEKTKPENQNQFRKELWSYHIQDDLGVDNYIQAYLGSEDEIAEIELAAAQSAPRWTSAVELFNDRFIDMPFRLSVDNQTAVALGKEQARLKFIFEEDGDSFECNRSQVQITLSQGERRALYLLNFIFEVESRIISRKETVFIIDDAADSFDYKNKHAIVQYLKDLNKHGFFSQIVLTHNFDFFRSLESSYVSYGRCLMANKTGGSISLVAAEGIRNIFVKKWKVQVPGNERIVCASIPFVRNLIEYTKGEDDPDYLKLTSLLHWKSDTESILVGHFLEIYNRLFGTMHSSRRDADTVKDVLFACADTIKNQDTDEGLCLEDKVLMSIAIRLKAEIFLTTKIRVLTSDSEYWCQSKKQFGKLMIKFQSLSHNASELKTLEKVSLTVSSNIHLNSFMYEPILDLSIEHLTQLYNEVCALN
jgi:hypothetical protein